MSITAARNQAGFSTTVTQQQTATQANGSAKASTAAACEKPSAETQKTIGAPKEAELTPLGAIAGTTMVVAGAMAVTAPWWLNAIPAVGTPGEAAAAAVTAVVAGIVFFSSGNN